MPLSGQNAPGVKGVQHVFHQECTTHLKKRYSAEIDLAQFY
jgi:hypothetical protein